MVRTLPSMDPPGSCDMLGHVWDGIVWVSKLWRIVYTLLTERTAPAQPQGSNIRHYYSYILSRAKAYRDTKLDWVREGQGRLKRQTIDKGLLRETEIAQNQIAALVKCDVRTRISGTD